MSCLLDVADRACEPLLTLGVAGVAWPTPACSPRPSRLISSPLLTDHLAELCFERQGFQVNLWFLSTSERTCRFLQMLHLAWTVAASDISPLSLFTESLFHVFFLLWLLSSCPGCQPAFFLFPTLLLRVDSHLFQMGQNLTKAAHDTSLPVCYWPGKIPSQ